MINGMSNIKGSNVRRAVIFLLLVGFCVAIFAPSAAATQWSPTKTFPDRDRIVIRPEYDDGGWNDVDSKGGWQVGGLLGCYDIRITAPTLFLWFLDLMDMQDSPNQGNGNDRQDIDPSTSTPSQ